MNEELPYLIALSAIRGLGPVKAKGLIRHVGSAREIFRMKEKALCAIPEIGRVTAKAIAFADFRRASQECDFIEKEGIRVASWNETHYPERLKQCDDSPLLLYARGNFEWNPKRAISIVGTRKADSYGKHFCNTLLEALTDYNPTIISGLAHGIDGAAHRAAVERKLPTLACVAHGLERIYPPAHHALAMSMENNGGIVSEFMSRSEMAPEMFPMRNRIIAGMADCTIVVQTDVKGGSMITAHIAHSYGREVFAVPGRVNDPLSKGCHKLIKNNLAAIITSADDLVHYLQWDQKQPAQQTALVFSEHPDENAQLILNTLRTENEMSFDELISRVQLSWGMLNSLLLQLEFEGRILMLPGKRYRAIR
jgi:DNA processing protein